MLQHDECEIWYDFLIIAVYGRQNFGSFGVIFSSSVCPFDDGPLIINIVIVFVIWPATTTEVYPDSPTATPEQCNAAQVACICGGLDWLVENDMGDRERTSFSQCNTM